jgi:hypothetical protein
MAHRIPMRAFMQALFEDTTLAAQAAEIAQALLAARPLLLTDMAAKKRKGVNRGPGRSPPRPPRRGRPLCLPQCWATTGGCPYGAISRPLCQTPSVELAKVGCPTP